MGRSRWIGIWGVKDWIRLSPLAVAVALAGCAVGPDYQMPSALLPSQYLPQVREAAPQSTTPESVDLTQWWRTLHDRELDSLVARARGSNLDVAIALDRLQEARMLVTVAVSDALPVAGATAGGGVGTGTDETKGRVTGPLRAGNNAQNLKKISETGGFDATWELDLFGKFRREVEAQTADAEALKDARDWLLVTVTADVARAYHSLRKSTQVAMPLQSCWACFLKTSP